ncbi:putative F-box/LRR-repeat protein At3g58880 isoform X2 [Sorghum bicolor]|uniref:putative F-box/LRR-repeat protein At3g58880 isoform X2 n=1 Tax=Sorghum bicolor TaxID=4558 RepID=UPI000B424219|nr:putative F-box/LRR-repeat protein At3g58880 isoform X2 [Sorghum bicolor]|eukprot:XP_021308873.1 putative F-box/LRR-repeat protein At3g58880 isoform X2 [Sorghum bicolor]
MDSALPPPPGDPPPPDSADECIPPKKRGTWHSDQQPVTFIPPKKRRIWRNVQHPEVSNIDWISAMPDDILVKILSLVTIREAAMTDCLSSRWRHLWENIHQLSLKARAFGMQVLPNSNYLENPDLWNSEATKFVHKVNELLRHHNGSGVQEFKVQFPLTSAHAPDINRWVVFAVTSGAKSLKLLLSLCDVHGMVAIQHVEPYSFPLKHFTDVLF